MRLKRWFYLFLAMLGLAAGIGFTFHRTVSDEIVSFTIDPTKEDLKFYWKDEVGNNFRTIANLKKNVEGKGLELVFAMNGGMYKKDFSPQGLFIQDGKTLTTLDTANGTGNFYLKPNGIFYLSSANVPSVCKTADFNKEKVKYATQSGPMLVIDGQIHPAFTKGSANLNIRNGVGILPGNKVVFAMSKKEINFYDFAEYFQDIGCKNALYLDGFVSRAYIPEKNWIQTDGNFGVIIGATRKKKK